MEVALNKEGCEHIKKSKLKGYAIICRPITCIIMTQEQDYPTSVNSCKKKLV